MVWQPTGSQASGLEDEDIRCGTVRSSMTVNPLLTKPALGQVKKTLFNNPPPEKVFGYTPPRDPEGAREVTAIWKEHRSSPAAGEVKPVKDFKTMNKLAVDSGLTTAKELPAFRASHNVMVSPEAPKKSSPKLPSDRDRTFSYGMASAYRTPEVVRTHGPQEPPVKYLVQGAYQDEWVMNNLQREATTQRGRPYIPPAPTKAVMGHSVGAARYLQPHSTEEPFKMAKFKAVESRVTQYMGGRTGASMTGGSGAAHYQQQYQQDQQEQYYHESSEPYSGGEGAQS